MEIPSPQKFIDAVLELINQCGPNLGAFDAKARELMEETLIELGYREGINLIRTETEFLE